MSAQKEPKPVAWAFRKALVQKLRWDKPIGGENVLRHWEPLYTAEQLAQIAAQAQAAPLLLSALESLCHCMEWNIKNFKSEPSPFDDEALAEARAAITAAKEQA